MPTLKESIGADAEVFLNADEFADQVTIGGQSVLAVVDYDDSPDDPAMGDGRASWATVIVSAADVASPSYRLEVAIGGVTWFVSTWSGDGNFWDLKCTTNVRPMRR